MIRLASIETPAVKERSNHLPVDQAPFLMTCTKDCQLIIIATVFNTWPEILPMSINGVWSSEIAGAYGWEAIGLVFLKNGRLMGGGAHHYSFGRYKKKKDGTIVFKVTIHQFGKQRPLFGEHHEKLSVVARMRRDGDRMEGEAFIPGGEERTILLRYKKRDELPK